MDSDRTHQLVMNWLMESGFNESLRKLEEESGISIVCCSKAGELESIVAEYDEQSQTSHYTTEEIYDRKLENELLEGGRVECIPTTEGSIYDRLHQGNILSVSFSPLESNLVVTGSADRCVVLYDFDANAELFRCVMEAPVLCTRLNPNPCNPRWILVGCMDGSIAVLDSNTHSGDPVIARSSTTHPSIIFFQRVHGKYVVKVEWTSDGLGFVTASHDNTVKHYQIKEEWKSTIEVTVDGTVNQITQLSLQESPDVFEFVKEYVFRGPVESIVVIPIVQTVITAVRGDDVLYYIDLVSQIRSEVPLTDDPIQRVPFTVLDLAISPNTEFLLAATDSGRHILYRIGTSRIVRQFFGSKSGQYSQPRVCFHPSGFFVASNCADSPNILIWDISTQRVVRVLTGHQNEVRALQFSSDGNRLVSGAFDKTVRLWV